MNEAGRTRREHHPWVNRVVLALLRSPLRGALDGEVCELRYQASRQSRTIALPVQYARNGDDVIVLVARATAKTWWRAFMRPRPLQLRIDGALRSGSGRIVHPDHPACLAARRTYEALRRVRIGHGDRMLLVTLADPASATGEVPELGGRAAGHADAVVVTPTPQADSALT